MNAVEQVKAYNAYELAQKADRLVPDRDGPGARFLDSVRDQVLTSFHQNEMTDDALSEIADRVSDVYTYLRWQEFIDLGAWEEESESPLTGSMTDMAGIVLYQIAYRLACVLRDELQQA
jgi:hypothetical protein